MVDLRELLSGLASDAPALTVRELCDDSRKASPASLFIARTGPRGDGREHIAQAVSNGAIAVACEAPVTDAHRRAAGVAALVEIDDLAMKTGLIAERFYGEPARDLAIVGVTGTNGKTTVAHLTAGLLRSAGLSTACIGTLGVDIDGKPLPTGLTTPGAIELSRILARARDAGVRCVVLETSSHALEQGRVEALRFDVAVFTNLSRDHLDDHGDMETYARAKARLFASLAPEALAVVNAEDPEHGRMIAAGRARVVRCGLDARVTIEKETLDALELTLTGGWDDARVTPRLIGRFNAMNALQAFIAAREICEKLGASADVLGSALSALGGPPGRLERVGDGSPRVFVDFAHTPGALEATLEALRPLTDGKIVCVFGCGGDRDAGKRPEMGGVVSELADTAVLTSDNPRREDPASIIAEVLGGMTGRAHPIVEADRAAAIRAGVGVAGERDVVVIAGKGHEDYQLLPDGEGGVRRIDFDDRVVAASALRDRRGEGAAA